MANKTNKKGFNAGVYAVFAGVVVAVALVLLTIYAVTTRYTAFSPEKVAQTYVDTIAQGGDGYNAYKNTLVSKNQKYGNFIINAYMAPYINDGDDAVKADFIGKGDAEEDEKSSELYNVMFDYYVELVDEYGFDNYDALYKAYFAELKVQRNAIYGDDYMDTDFMFSVFESNVSTYSQLLTGTEETLAADDVTVLVPETKGIYENIFGKDYSLTVEVAQAEELTDSEYTDYIDGYVSRISSVASEDAATAEADVFGLTDEAKENYVNAYKNLDLSQDINGVEKCTVNVKLNNNEVVASVTVYVVQIGNSWYVDNTNTTTKDLYTIGYNSDCVTNDKIVEQKALYDTEKAKADADNAKIEK